MIKAQEAYNASFETISGIDISDVMIKIEESINKSIEEGFFVTFVQPFKSDVAELVGIKLRDEYGYNVYVTQSGIPIVEDGKPIPGYALRIDWLNMPQNTREHIIAPIKK